MTVRREQTEAAKVAATPARNNNKNNESNNKGKGNDKNTTTKEAVTPAGNKETQTGTRPSNQLGCCLTTPWLPSRCIATHLTWATLQSNRQERATRHAVYFSGPHSIPLARLAPQRWVRTRGGTARPGGLRGPLPQNCGQGLACEKRKSQAKKKKEAEDGSAGDDGLGDRQGQATPKV